MFSRCHSFLHIISFAQALTNLKLQLLYYHHFNVSTVIQWSWIWLRKKVLQRWLLKRDQRKGGNSRIWIQSGKMNVGSAWSLAQKWQCQAVATQCASTATVTGTRNHFSLSLSLIWNWSFDAHSFLIKCYRNTRSESCPFCRGSLKRVNSGDLWVLTCIKDVVDSETVLREDMLRFYLYINSLPKDIPDALFLMYYEYLI